MSADLLYGADTLRKPSCAPAKLDTKPLCGQTVPDQYVQTGTLHTLGFLIHGFGAGRKPSILLTRCSKTSKVDLSATPRRGGGPSNEGPQAQGRTPGTGPARWDLSFRFDHPAGPGNNGPSASKIPPAQSLAG